MAAEDVINKCKGLFAEVEEYLNAASMYDFDSMNESSLKANKALMRFEMSIQSIKEQALQMNSIASKAGLRKN